MNKFWSSMMFSYNSFSYEIEQKKKWNFIALNLIVMQFCGPYKYFYIKKKIWLTQRKREEKRQRETERTVK